MSSINARFIQSGFLLASLCLTACIQDGTSTSTAAPAAVAPAPVITSMGKDFYLTLPDHLCVSNPAKCDYTPVTNKLIVAAATATTGDYTFNGVTTPFSVAAGAETVITLDSAVVLIANETIEAKGIHVTALSPVSVHVVSENANSADGYLGLPTPGLGTNYYIMSYASAASGGYDGTGSEFAVVATQNSTTVTITPTAAGATKAANIAFTVLLNAGETYQLSNPANADMTGSHVTADKPIAVFSGHRCADVPTLMGYCDYLVEELTDVSIWGKIFHTSPFSGRGSYTVRVIASQNGTTFTSAPAGMVSTLNAGEFAEVTLAVASEIVSNKPVLVAQFMHGYMEGSTKGDPSMVMVTPAEMGMTDATFGVYGLVRNPSSDAFAYMNVVTETSALVNLKLDNVAVNTSLFTQIGTSNYSAGTIQVVPGVHSLIGSAPYSALVYDYGISLNWVSYAYPVAAMLSLPISAVPSTTGCVDEDQHNKDNHLPNALDHFGKTNHAAYHDQGAEDDDSHECH